MSLTPLKRRGIMQSFMTMVKERAAMLQKNDGEMFLEFGLTRPVLYRPWDPGRNNNFCRFLGNITQNIVTMD